MGCQDRCCVPLYAGSRAIGFDPELEAMLGKVAVDVDALKTRSRG
jgi:hypothetical protein